MTETLHTSRELLGHPRGLFVLFMTEMWERFSYYGMRALLILYLTKHFLFGDSEAGLIYGSYASLVYAMPVLGGIIADRYLGYRKAIAFGAVLLVCGHFGMAFEGPTATMQDGVVERSVLHSQIFYLSLAFIIVGVGFLKANISTIVGQLYSADDPRRDGGFTIFYMGINIGAFVATLACAYLGENYGWSYGFGLAGIGMLFGLVTFHRGRNDLMGYGEPPKPESLQEIVVPGVTRERLIYLIGVVSVFGIWQVIQYTAELGVVLVGFGLIVVTWMIWFSVRHCTPLERNRMLVMLFLIVMSVFFWALFEQAGSSLTLFTDRNVDMGATFTAGMFQSLNPLFIILFAPVFAYLWVKLQQRGLEPSTPAKFGLGLLQVGLGFAVLVYGASVSEDGKVAVIWLALMYLLHTTGELCLSPVGLSMITKLSVQRIAAMMMGVWFLSSAFAAYAAGVIAGLTAIESVGGEVAVSPLESLLTYTTVFERLALVAIVLGVAMLAIAPWLHRLIYPAQAENKEAIQAG